MLERELKRQKLVDRYGQRRQKLKEAIKSSIDQNVIEESISKIAKLPVNSSPVRQVTRCNQCGRPHAVYRKFGLCRICLRNRLMKGDVPGGRKSSW